MPENFNARRHDEKFLRLVVVTILLMTDVGNRRAAEYSRDVVIGKGKPKYLALSSTRLKKGGKSKA